MKKLSKIDFFIALPAIIAIVLSSLSSCQEEEIKPTTPGKLATGIPAHPNRPENSADHK